VRMIYLVHAHSGDQILGGGHANGCMSRFFFLFFFNLILNFIIECCIYYKSVMVFFYHIKK
jgi:hypothetical protein